MNHPHQAVMEILFGRWRSQILYAGVKLGVFDALGAGPKRAEEVASELQLNGPLIYRLLRALASLGLLSENPDRSFSLTASGEFLRADHPQTLRGITLLEEGPEHYAVWKHLCAIVREGGADGFVRERPWSWRPSRRTTSPRSPTSAMSGAGTATCSAAC